MTILQSALLIERINKNMDDFKASLLELDKETIITKARKIAAMEDAYYHLTTQCDLDDSEAHYLLLFQNPLEHIADEWASRLDDMGCDFHMALYEFFMRDDADYPLMSDLEDYDIHGGQDSGFDDDYVDSDMDQDAALIALDMLAECVSIMESLLSICGFDVQRKE